MPAIKRPVKDRFFEKVDVTPSCWLWTARKDKDGYGNLRVEGRPQRAHRVAYTLFVGEIPDGLCVLHTCDTPACVNPEHLFLGTVGENNTDRKVKGRNGEQSGPAGPNARFTADLIRYIRHSPATGASLARAFGVSAGVISEVRSRKTYKNII